ncbi:aerobic glycerol-3-phosphate dehydrogenase GlpD [Sodalis glossinidius str. 'morsitans']|uniref:Glycerol-3-phosphate dehydrogenase n=1 Tax=Sodalis glossinidius (strain morsitans) TaxID=343509 RepID=Q2NQH1_SODGM|nr:aerobic glycerol-3-phosphate dehydrogenase GlpD [Sodalis glossinidius str. 'morsitans']
METKDLIVIGGGINGTGIASDAAGRGLSVLLLEAQDLACATSSASSKLIHGGLRYLEHYEIRLVSEALAEREVLLKMAPHIAFPMRFRLPHRPHLRPAWMIRVGLFMYDHLGKRTSLPASQSVRFGADSVLKPEIMRGFEYSDCWVDDARLVVLNAQEVVAHGGEVKTRTQVTRAWRKNGLWQVEARDSLTGKQHRWHAKGLANATGPWAKHFIDESLHLPSQYGIRLIKGSHIVVPCVHHQPQAYILQNEDHRIVFVIPWMETFSIIGTTDVEYHGDPGEVHIDESEIDYLLKVYNAHFQRPLGREDIVWTFSGVRPLCDDESNSPQAVTRDYTLSLSDENGQAPLLSVFGGKLTTYRKLAEYALEKLAHYYPHAKGAWTSNAVLPGGDFAGTRDDYTAVLRRKFAFLPEALARRYSHTYGTRSEQLLAGVTGLADLGEDFGHGLYEAELRYLVAQEWVVTLDDAIWRRTKLGMWLDEAQQTRITDWLVSTSARRGCRWRPKPLPPAGSSTGGRAPLSKSPWHIRG